MANYAAADVKKLRDATGAGMMDAKKALDETDGDFDAAIEVLRVKGAAKVAKRAGDREAANGLVAAAENAMILLACETDFVAKGEDFQTLAGNIVAHLAGSSIDEASAGAADPAAFAEKLKNETLADGRTVQENIDALAAIIGEKLVLTKAVKLSGTVATYLHKKSADLPAQVGVLVQFAGDGEGPLAAARGAAMQVAAMRPAFLQREDVPAETVETEKRVAEAKAREDGKPEQALPKIIEGTVNSYYKNNVLLEQASVQDPKKSVKALLDDAGALVTGFAHFEVG
jgi:elongation factor Ts